MREMDVKDLVKRIKELEFAAVDLNLFLDNNPTCQQAISDFNIVHKELMDLKEMYNMRVGPLQNFGNSPSKSVWTWVDEPWPWESGE
ncbi:CotJB protein [Oxobacter pfennigii]|uniref:CotJB protein n=1 Tax=Oxobacter pfennigii TaxID=36849 RepID=A0A0P8WRC9_9CLOT|nr:spore coat protein CotJB [Oxobacter pfennigii]KPU45137.1 CotJB protein [Oxobacter pfennigii]